MSNLVANPENLEVSVEVEQRRKTRGRNRRLGPIHYSPGTIGEFEESICDWLQSDRQTNFIVGYVNPHVFNIAWNIPAVRHCLESCDIAAVDGLGVAVAVSLLTRAVQTRTVMTPLFDRVLARNKAAANAILIGGSANVVSNGCQSINGTSNGINVAVTATGYEPLETYLALIEDHPECEVILVAMGSPRSEELVLAATQRFTGKLLWNIGGGTLHFYAGTQRRTPHVVSSVGLQWLWRIAHQPSIAPRYIFGTPLYMARLIATIIRPRKFNT
jgi:N-acetylglucosaminyldiphosphoundecaprenol N-acetyl-beta-D-mannosaminyltransferase